MIQKEKLTSFAEKVKKGISVNEMQTFAHKYMAEVFIVIAIIIAMVSSGFKFFSGAGWSIFFAGFATIIGMMVAEKSCDMRIKLFKAIYKQEKAMQIVVGIIRILIAIFLPFIIFAELGFISGIAFNNMMKDGCSCGKKTTKSEDKEEKSIERDEEHI